MSAVMWDRFQFGFTVTFHYLFPQLTMGLALIIVLFKWLALRHGDPKLNDAARFFARLFGLNFVMGVVTGIPLEFQFGTNWAGFADRSGGVVGMTLAMEGMFAFFAESAFLGLFLFGEERLGQRKHLMSAVMVFAGSWLSGYFIVATNAFMQHPVGYAMMADGRLRLAHPLIYLFNRWAFWEYAHTMSAAVITGAFAVSSVAAWWILSASFPKHGISCLKVVIPLAFAACLLQLFPTGDRQGKLVARYQPGALAGMEGRFKTESNADLIIIGQPDPSRRRLENPIAVPRVLSYLAYGSFGHKVTGLDDVPGADQPDNVVLLYYAYHIMVGLGTLFIAIMGAAAWLLLRRRLESCQPMLWLLMLAFPFPFIATTAGWLSAELGRQPWVVWGVQRTANSASPAVSSGDAAFTSLGFLGLYSVLFVLFLFLLGRELRHGPVERATGREEAQ
ncbi:MAG: cytochrome ubiquinol oxidase subunit I [Armatimonadetes bacterium]|nr:cytochrome ubiquinol oxidase subunit I [Armatimonadota bacterium]MDE2205020.1 cytochrome ubiquinol oxidase subunit I [Armatimonadota bacterium]